MRYRSLQALDLHFYSDMRIIACKKRTLDAHLLLGPPEIHMYEEAAEILENHHTERLCQEDIQRSHCILHTGSQKFV